MNYLIHATPIHPSLCLQYFILLFTINTITAFTLILLLLFYYCHHYKIIATDKPLWARLFPGATELTTHLLRLINILWLPLCRINKFGFYFPRRLLRSPILVGHQGIIYKLSGAIAKLASINLRKLVLSLTGSINLGFILREEFLLCSSYLPFGVPN
jgi:hypothetical protein